MPNSVINHSIACSGGYGDVTLSYMDGVPGDSYVYELLTDSGGLYLSMSGTSSAVFTGVIDGIYTGRVKAADGTIVGETAVNGIVVSCGEIAPPDDGVPAEPDYSTADLTIARSCVTAGTVFSVTVKVPDPNHVFSAVVTNAAGELVGGSEIGAASSFEFGPFPPDFYTIWIYAYNASDNTLVRGYDANAVPAECVVTEPPISDPSTCDLITGKPEHSPAAVFFPITTSALPVSYRLEEGAELAEFPADYTLRNLDPGEYEIFIIDAAGCNQSIRFSVYPAFSDGDDGFRPDDSADLCARYYLEVAGVYTEIAEPMGFDAIEIIRKRDLKAHGFFKTEFSELDLDFDCEAGRELLKAEYEAGGNDARVGFKSFKWDPERGEYIVLYAGEIDFNNYIEDLEQELVRTNIKRRVFGDVFRTRLKTKVDLTQDKSLDELSIDPLPSVGLELHSKGLSMEYKAAPDDFQAGNYSGSFFISSGTNEVDRADEKFLQIEFADKILDELATVYTYPTAFNPEIPSANYVAAASGLHNFTLRLVSAFRIKSRNDRSGSFGADARLDGCSRGSGTIRDFIIEVKVTINGVTKFIKSFSPPPACGRYSFSVDRQTIAFTGEQELAAGDAVRVFVRYRVAGRYQEHLTQNSRVLFDFEADIWPESLLKIEAVTLTAPSTARGFFIHEAASKLMSLVTSRSNAFRSEYFGRPTSRRRAYAQAGPGSGAFIASGEAIRQIPGAPIATSLEDLLTSLQAIHSTGHGFETEAGSDILVAEELAYFYNKSFAVVAFDNPDNLEIEVASDYIFNEVELGFKKFESEDKRGRDEHASKIRWLTQIRTAEKKLSLLSEYIGSGYLLEQARRKPYKATESEDFKTDKDIFIIDAIDAGTEYFIFGAAENSISVSPLVGAGGLLAIGDAFSISKSAVYNGVYTVKNIYNTPPDLFGLTLTIIETEETIPAADPVDGVILIAGSGKAARDEKFELVEGVLSPSTVYNLDLAPALTLARHAGRINSGLWFKPVSAVYKFLPSEGNNALRTKRHAPAPGDPDRLDITHNANRRIQDLDRGAKLWRPEIITFKTGISQAEREAISAAYNPDATTTRAHRYGYIEVWNGTGYLSGFLLEERFKISENSATFKLLNTGLPLRLPE